MIERIDAYLASVNALYRAGEVIERWERREQSRLVAEERACDLDTWFELGGVA